MKTSKSHPLRIDWVNAPSGNGRIGMTFCPGKKQAHAMTGSWDRDLIADLDVIQASGSKALATLMEKSELAKSGVPMDLLKAQVEKRGLRWLFLPIKDVSIPDEKFDQAWQTDGLLLRKLIFQGESVVLHCRGGLGRTGTIAARLLVEMGMAAKDAIEHVRISRPGTIETRQQEEHVRKVTHKNDVLIIQKKVIKNSNVRRQSDHVSVQERRLACVMGGAVGDAFGYEVEFQNLATIKDRFGLQGMSEPVLNNGELIVSDDTQMTLFTLEAVLDCNEGDSIQTIIERIRLAYLDWYHTQQLDTEGFENVGNIWKEKSLQVQRAPGNCCMTSLSGGGGGTPESPINHNKGCGGVMRVAPVGLFPEKWNAELAFEIAMRAAAITHTHPSGYLSAGIMGFVLMRLLDQVDLSQAVEQSFDLLTKIKCHEEVLDKLRQAVELSESNLQPTDAVEAIGKGWVGEEALAIGVYATLKGKNYREVIQIAANHSGDSDSTASIAGQIYGAWKGMAEIPAHWIDSLDIKEVVMKLLNEENDLPNESADTGVEALVNSWFEGSASVSPEGKLRIKQQPQRLTPVEKMHLAYDWIAQKAILTSQGDIQPDMSRQVGNETVKIELARGKSFSSFLLLPLLNLATGRHMVFVGAPGRGKTSVATLMSLLTGSSLKDARRHIQHGHPQMTVNDLLGSPLPSSLINASTSREVKVDWRGWIIDRVKIVDEYNRIPTKTQSALLSLLAEGYAEMYEQTIETGRSAWFLTANDETGGGTFPVIDALKDRIDAAVRCAPFQMEHLDALLERLNSDQGPENEIPEEVIFSAEDLEEMDQQIHAVKFPEELLEMVGFVLGQLEFCRMASDQLDYMNKDTLHLSGKHLGHVCTEDCPLDRHSSLCAQTENGVSPRALQSLLHYAQALAFFLGREYVEMNDIRELLPWVLFERLRPNLQSPSFEIEEHRVLMFDRASWIKSLFDAGVQQFSMYQSVHEEVIECLVAVKDETLPIQSRLVMIEQQISKLLDTCELNAAVHADILRLRRHHNQLHQCA